MKIVDSDQEMHAIIRQRRRVEAKIAQRIVKADKQMPWSTALGIAEAVTRGE